MRNIPIRPDHHCRHPLRLIGWSYTAWDTVVSIKTMRSRIVRIVSDILFVVLFLFGIPACQEDHPWLSGQESAEETTGNLWEEDHEYKPGMLADYHSLVPGDEKSHWFHIDAKPAFFLEEGSLHPRLAQGPFEITWTGLLRLSEEDRVTFGAYLLGQVELTLDGDLLLQAKGDKSSEWVESTTAFERQPGLYHLHIRYRSPAGPPARLQIWWQGRTFSREPLHAWRLQHIPGELPEAATQEELFERGRAAVNRFGCAQCHRSSFPSVEDRPPGPALTGVGDRIGPSWLMSWLEDPSQLRQGARMPGLFSPDRAGYVERWVVSEYLATLKGEKKGPAPPAGDHVKGRSTFVGRGCATCHLLPDQKAADREDDDRMEFMGVKQRMSEEVLARFLLNPHDRYPDGRMPRFPLDPKEAADMAAYILLWSSSPPRKSVAPVAAQELHALVQRLGLPAKPEMEKLGRAVMEDKGCAGCHPGLWKEGPQEISIRNVARGCLSGETLPRFSLDGATRGAIKAYLTVSRSETQPSSFQARRRLIDRSGCLRCHTRDTDQASEMERIGGRLDTPLLPRLPYQRVPSLTAAVSKYKRPYLLSAIREGVTGVRPSWYSYRMPIYGDRAEEIVRALAETDGENWSAAETRDIEERDPTLAAAGRDLVGFHGYSCVSCHIWEGKMLRGMDSEEIGPELTGITSRIRRRFFDRWVESPLRVRPQTPMPSIFTRGEPASLTSILEGDPDRQKDAMWAYLKQGTRGLAPEALASLPIAPPETEGRALVAQIPLRPPDDAFVEAICVLTARHDALLYEVDKAVLLRVYTGARLVRMPGKYRSFHLEGKAIASRLSSDRPLRIVSPGHDPLPLSAELEGYDRLPNGVRIRLRYPFKKGVIHASEEFRLRPLGEGDRLVRRVRFRGIPESHSLEWRTRGEPGRISFRSVEGEATGEWSGEDFVVRLLSDASSAAAATLVQELPPAEEPEAPKTRIRRLGPSRETKGSLERPGYRAIHYPMPKTAGGEDAVMPCALAVDQETGNVLIASMKFGEIFVLRDPHDDGRDARFENFGQGLFQEPYGLRYEKDGLYVLHRRNITRIRDEDGDGIADRFDRIARFPQALTDTYDWGYGLVRDREGSWIVSFPPWGSRWNRGSGSVLRLTPQGEGLRQEEIGFGLRNPWGWGAGPEGEIFFTDNQGEWTAACKLTHVVPGHFYGFRNQEQKEHARKPHYLATVWVPYAWGRSVNGLAYDTTEGRFGPFAGQFFLAEIMYGGKILRANVEKVNGVYQGACFPFWGKGLLGPLTLAFDPKGRLFVGSITEPSWMGKADRGALYRIEFTGETPFEIHSIQVVPQGFRLNFTDGVDPDSAGKAASYTIEHFRYEYSAAYGSPELDRRGLRIERIQLASDGRSVDLLTTPLVKGRVYMIRALGVRSRTGKPLVHPVGAYTLNEIPSGNSFPNE